LQVGHGRHDFLGSTSLRFAVQRPAFPPPAGGSNQQMNAIHPMGSIQKLYKLQIDIDIDGFVIILTPRRGLCHIPEF
jgi:hypothetical protein